jgi:hypothetical protein
VHHLLLFVGTDTEIASKFDALRLAIGRDYAGLLDAYLVIRGAQTAPSDVLVDWDGAVHALYEAEAGAILLIRPDGYIGFRGGARHAEALREQLLRIFTGENLHGR